LLLAAGLAGLYLALDRRKNLELVAFCALQASPCLIFFVTDRYRMPSMSVWAVFAGAFVAHVTNAMRARAWRSGIAPLAAAICIAIASNLNCCVVRNPDYRPHFNLGFIYETQTKYDWALEEYSTALALVKKVEPRDSKTESEIYARLGNVYMISNNLEAARMNFERAITVNPDSGPAYSYLGTLYDKKKQSALAVTMFRKALEINPWDVVSLHNLGLFYLNNNQFDEALTQLNRVLELAPEHAGAHNDLAYLYGQQGKYDLMEAEAKSALYYDPKKSPARYNLALLYLNTGRVEEAMAQYRAIIRTAPHDSSNAYNQLGVMYAERGDRKQAIDSWQRALEIDPNNASALANIQRARAMLR